MPYRSPSEQPASLPLSSLPMLNLFAALEALQRVPSLAARPGSVALRLWQEAWTRLAQGESAEAVMATCLAGALAATRIGDLDTAGLVALGVAPGDAPAARRRAFTGAAAPLDAELRALARAGLEAPAVLPLPLPPGLGDSAPAAGRGMVLALQAVLLCPEYGADPATIFLVALSRPFCAGAEPPAAALLAALPDTLRQVLAFAWQVMTIPGRPEAVLLRHLTEGDVALPGQYRRPAARLPLAAE